MAIDPISSIQSTSLTAPTSPAQKSAPAEVPFSSLISELVQETNSQQQAVGGELEKLIAGESTSMHDLVLTAAKADLSFRFLMEIRDRLISSYQEVMRMQV